MLKFGGGRDTLTLKFLMLILCVLEEVRGEYFELIFKVVLKIDKGKINNKNCFPYNFMGFQASVMILFYIVH